ncbi:MAG: Asp23/Gls24 family envelope stress response protein [Synergistaceae bacterium]|nr:Asp23/Gls24 family envelope stress response protein [Synergistaceae bacterium]
MTKLDNEILSGVKTFAFIGAAGTGKSQRAQLVSSLLNADYIIDDGLVIHKGSIVSGKSAKSERNQISAIRRALFEFEDHRNEVVSFFKMMSPCSVMVIGTSDTMVLRILHKLRLNVPTKILRIEDVATSEEIAKARRERFNKGQHVIPVSHVLVRKNFAGKLVGQLRVFWKSKNQSEGEKTIVRPPFSFYGEVHIEPEAVKQLVCFIATRTAQVSKVTEVNIIQEEEDRLSIEIKIAVTIGDTAFLKLATSVKERVAVSVRFFTGLDIKHVNVVVSEVLI